MIGQRSKYTIVAIDPGYAALGLATIKGGKVTSIDTLKGVGYIQQDVVEAAHKIMNMVRQKDGNIPYDIIFVIELPAARYYGKGNTTSLIKLFHQITYLGKELLLAGCNLLYQDSYTWNAKDTGGQFTDKEKAKTFKSVYEDTFPSSNAHNRDAALMGLWVWNTLF